MPYFGQFDVFLAIVIAGCAIAAVLFVLLILVLRYWPRLHFGVPAASIELRSFSKVAITTGKDNKPIEGETWREFQRLKVSRWCGLASRNSARWFLGIIIFAEKDVL